ncbi:hypothetical protein THRCLA_06622, partial [Thraustotheca clavata]
MCSSVLMQEVGSVKSRFVTAVLTCLKKRHPESAVLCLRCISLMSINLGSDEDAFFNSIHQVVRRTITDQCDAELRTDAIYALSIAVFFCTTEDQPKWELIELLGSLITGRNLDKDDTSSISDDQKDNSDDVSDDDPLLIVAAIECWTFLVSFFNPSQIVPMIYDQSSKCKG